VTSSLGILLTNSGTPEAPTPPAVKAYLQEFLSDRRIVQLPRWLWLPILHSFILLTRPQKAAKLYEKIWTPEGSPMRVIMQSLRNKLHRQTDLPIAIGMNYGTPSIAEGLHALAQQGVEHILVLPLYPQYSYTTTESSIDRVLIACKRSNQFTKIRFTYVKGYAEDMHYLTALANSIRPWLDATRHLVFSFHGIPQRFANKGDPYQQQCEQTATALANALHLSPAQWTLGYQSQFGYDRWLQPALSNLLVELPQRGILSLDVVCPGFAVDCLETLEEIALRSREIFMAAGGKSFRYIPALNDSDAQVAWLDLRIKRYQETGC